MIINIYKGRKVRHKLDERVIIVRSKEIYDLNKGDWSFRGVYVNKVTGKLEEDLFIPEEVKSCA